MTTETPRLHDAPLPQDSSVYRAAQRGASAAFRTIPANIVEKTASNSGARAAAMRANMLSSTTATPNGIVRARIGELQELEMAVQQFPVRRYDEINAPWERPKTKTKPSDYQRSSSLQCQNTTSGNDRSASILAATLAASKSTSRQVSVESVKKESSYTKVSPRQTGSLKAVDAGSRDDHTLDTRSIPPANALICMFEQKTASRAERPGKLSRTLSAKYRNPAPVSQRFVSTRTQSPEPLDTKRSAPPTIKSPKPILQFALGSSVATPRPPAAPLSKPMPIHLKSASIQNPATDDDASSDDSSLSYANNPSWRVMLQDQNRRRANVSLQSVNTIDSMANAIVASSLASSRAASPSRSMGLDSNNYPPIPPSSRRSPHRHLFHTSTAKKSRTPSPAKPTVLRMTMRKPKAEEEDEGDARRKKKAHMMKKHPNKHHEGDRKRWRDEITERERKRYEAVWASNKGLHTDVGFETSVCNLVARDIFSRSRLPVDVLEEVYSLVDRQQIGVLDKDEFVIGLWLVDQRLKGRKLPIRVSDSVWKSVGALSGIKIRNAWS